MTSYSLHAQLPGALGIWQTVGMMRTMVNESFTHPWIRDRAVDVSRSCGRDSLCQARALWRWVRGAMTYINDPAGVEALHHPVSWVERRLRAGESVYGDCDDHSMYLSALMKSVGLRPRFRMIDRVGKGWHHIAVVWNGQVFDPTLPIGAGQEVPRRAVQIAI